MRKTILSTLSVISILALIAVGCAEGFRLWMLPATLLPSAFLGMMIYANRRC